VPRRAAVAFAERGRCGRLTPGGPGPAVFRLATCGEGPGPLSPEGRGTVAGPSGNSRQEHPNPSRRRHWRWLWLLPGSIVSQGGAPGGRSDRPLRRARRRADLVRARRSLGGIAQLMLLAGPMPSPIQVLSEQGKSWSSVPTQGQSLKADFKPKRTSLRTFPVRHSRIRIRYRSF
jgi:hypothetical protein